MNPELKAAVQAVVRFFGALARKWSLWQLILATFGGIICLTLLAWFVLSVLGWSILGAVNEFADHGMSGWVIAKVALAMAMTLLFILTVGIPLMIDEARNWFTKIMVGIFTIMAAIKIIALFEPITATHPTAKSVLAASLFLFAFEAIAHVLGHPTFAKGFSWLARGLAMVFILWLSFNGVTKHFGWGKDYQPHPIAAVPIARTTPQPTTILVSIPPGQERILNSASILPGCRVYRVGWPQIESGRVKVFEGNDFVAKCEDYSGNKEYCPVDAMNQLRFKNVSNEEARFYYTVICLE